MNAPEKICIIKNSARRLAELGAGSFSLHVGEPGEYYVGYTLSSLTARWVSVKEKLPEKSGWYLSCNEYASPVGIFFDSPTGHWAGVTPTHWLFGVPKLPEGK